MDIEALKAEFKTASVKIKNAEEKKTPKAAVEDKAKGSTNVAPSTEEKKVTTKRPATKKAALPKAEKAVPKKDTK